MISHLVKKIFGSRNDRLLKAYRKKVEAINAFEVQMQALDDSALQGKTQEFQQRLAQGQTLDQILPEAFAVVREASRRVLGMRHFDVQLIGGMVLHDGRISEMRTGEGKTLMATLPVYLNALSGKGVHVVTVNDYLAKRDAAWMGKLYSWLGLTTGVIYSGQTASEKQAAYGCEITYGTNNEFGFDYLRDNMAFSANQRVMGELNFAVVDEVDSILIDEARTPLIISGQAEDNAQIYLKFNALPPLLTKFEGEVEEGVEPDGDFTLEGKSKQILLTEQGHEKVENWLTENGLIQPGTSLYDVQNIIYMHHVYAALRAHVIFERNKDYIVENGQVVIIDEFTGRKMAGRRWSEGLHQAVEAKEGVAIQAESQTLASITFQNFFRLYNKLSGMTGTADTEAAEFSQIYGLEVVIVPSNKPPQRQDHADYIYLNLMGKYRAIVKDVAEIHQKGQPVLVGTASIESSELLSHMFTEAGIPHEVLNAKQHEREAHIIAEAGRKGAVTLATNMAGRGTDIVLGGSLDARIEALDNPTAEVIAQMKAQWQQDHDEVLALGGLHVIGSERHDSRRIDNQLRGRSGRQGDPGSTRFYLSLEDDLMRRFASDRVKSMMQKLGMKEDEAIEHPWVTKAIANAQKKVEAYNFDIRKQLLEFDDVANDQRKVVYAQRRELMDADSVEENVLAMRHDVINQLISMHITPGSIDEQWEIAELEMLLEAELGERLPLGQWLAEDDHLNEESLRQKIEGHFIAAYQAKEALAGVDGMRNFEKGVLLQTIDTHWRDHLAAMERLRQGIHLRGYAQKNPVQEYKKEAFELFQSFLDRVKLETVKILCRVQIQVPEEAIAQVEAIHLNLEQHQPKDLHTSHEEVHSFATPDENHAQAPASGNDPSGEHQPFRREVPKVGRNDPCPCGSGKKYKHCHGRLE